MPWRWLLSGLFFGFGIIIFDPDSLKWGVATLLLYGVSLVCQFFKFQVLRLVSLWFGIFIVMQTLLTPYIRYHIEYRALLPNIDTTVQTEGEAQTITTDEMGFRVHPRINYNQKKGFRIFSLGGSTTEQIFIDDQKTWTYLLQESLSKEFSEPFEVVNTGVSGTRVRNHFAKLKRLIQYEPDMAIILAGVNDWNKQITDSVRIYKMEPYFLRKSLLAKALQGIDVFFLGPLKSKFFRDDSRGTKNIEPEKQTKNPEATRKKDSLRRSVEFSWKPEDVSDEFKVYLKKIQETCEEKKILCVLLTQPNGYQESANSDYKKLFWMTPPFANFTLDFESMIYLANLYNNHIRSFAKQNKMPLCDIANNLEASKEIFYDDCHFTVKGAQMVSEFVSPCLADILEKNKLVVRSN
jgi:lysophospholipase L1-like esterase